jgi:hypothetical protein
MLKQGQNCREICPSQKLLIKMWHYTHTYGYMLWAISGEFLVIDPSNLDIANNNLNCMCHT